MLDWLVITAEHHRAGRGVRGHALAWFLRTYFGRRRVAMATPHQWRAAPVEADTVFLGLPTSLTADELAGVVRGSRCRRLVLFDYLDYQHLAWTPEQEPVLRRLSNVYLKPWFEPAWNYGLRMGLLPLRRRGLLTAALLLQWARRAAGGLPPERTYDVGFLGQANYTTLAIDGRIERVDQRLQWLRDLKRQAPELALWGGLVRVDGVKRAKLEERFGDIGDLLYNADRMSFATYYRAMRRCRVLLCPGGNVPWTYRHYESLYAGAVVVTIDYRQRDLLVPLPRQGMVHVPDGAPVLPAVREALALSRERPGLGEENIAHLERYLRFGAYARTRPALIERFLSQLE